MEYERLLHIWQLANLPAPPRGPLSWSNDPRWRYADTDQSPGAPARCEEAPVPTPISTRYASASWDRRKPRSLGGFTFGPGLAWSKFINVRNTTDDLQRAATRAIVSRAPQADVAQCVARYSEHHQGLRVRVVIRLLERELDCSIAELRRCVSKRRNAAEQTTYERLAALLLGWPRVGRELLAAVLECHTRTIDRMIAYAAHDKQSEDTMNTKDAPQIIRIEHHHTVDVRVTVEREDPFRIRDAELAAWLEPERPKAA